MPPAAARPASVPAPVTGQVLPERIEIELVGGLAHGQKVTVRADRRRIEVPYAPLGAALEIPADGSRPEVIEAIAFTLVYTRDNDTALTATFTDLEMDE